MSTITLKNVPAAVHETLKSRAKAHGRSLNKEILATLQDSLGGVRLDAATVLRQAREVRRSINAYLTEDDLAALKDAGRQ